MVYDEDLEDATSEQIGEDLSGQLADEYSLHPSQDDSQDELSEDVEYDGGDEYCEPIDDDAEFLDDACAEGIIQAIREKLFEQDPRFIEQREMIDTLKQREQRHIFDSDLNSIKAEYPDEKASDISQLGDEFMQLCAAGIKPIAAYDAIRAGKMRTEKQPPSMGDVNGFSANEKSFYSRDEVERMSPKDVHKNYEKIRKSMASW